MPVSWTSLLQSVKQIQSILLFLRNILQKFFDFLIVSHIYISLYTNTAFYISRIQIYFTVFIPNSCLILFLICNKLLLLLGSPMLPFLVIILGLTWNLIWSIIMVKILTKSNWIRDEIAMWNSVVYIPDCNCSKLPSTDVYRRLHKYIWFLFHFVSVLASHKLHVFRWIV
jgi:hypothetical protein